jgi:hypothetical protein
VVGVVSLTRTASATHNRICAATTMAWPALRWKDWAVHHDQRERQDRAQLAPGHAGGDAGDREQDCGSRSRDERDHGAADPEKHGDLGHHQGSELVPR